MLRLNTRIPDRLLADLHAQVAACSVGAHRVAELADIYGDDLPLVFGDLLDRSEQLTRAVLRTIPEGTYRYVDYMDNDGIDLDQRMRIEVAVTLRDGEMHCDFTGTSPQVRGPFNCVPSGSLAAACFAIRVLTDPTIPTNGGCFRPIKLTIPEGSMLNPRQPAPVCSRTSTIKRVATSIIAALRPTRPEAVSADPGSIALLLSFGGRYADGKPYVMGEIVVAGSGACFDMDGCDVVDTDVSNSTNMPVEAIETEFPIRMVRYALRKDSGGEGMFRGGLGCVREYEVLSGPITLTHRGERFYCPAQGYDDGAAGMAARTRIMRADGSVEEVPSKIVTQLFAGDHLLIETAGGGGWGDPARRDPALREADIADGKVTVEAVA